MQEKFNPLAQAAKDIESLADSVRQIAAESPDVKAGRISVEDELKEPGYVLYTQIAKCTASIFSNQMVADTLKHLGSKIGEEAAADIMNLLAVCMTQASHQAIVFYDDLLKVELKQHMDRIIEQTNKNSATLQANNSVLQVYRKAINAINQKLMLSEITDQA